MSTILIDRFLETQVPKNVFSQPTNVGQTWSPASNNNFHLQDFDKYVSSSVGDKIGDISPHLVTGHFGFTIPAGYYITRVRINLYIGHVGSTSIVSPDYELYEAGFGILNGTYPDRINLVYPPSFTPIPIMRDPDGYDVIRITHIFGNPFFDSLNLTPEKINNANFASSFRIRKLSAGNADACRVYKMYLAVSYTDEPPVPPTDYHDDGNLLKMGTV